VSALKRSKHARAKEAHVRLYRYELECPAYRALSPAARALLVELRSLYSPASGDNRVFCGIRRIMKRCNLTQRAASRARDELLEKGWIKLVQMGGFNCKVRHATDFALENEAPNSGNGSQPGKAYMRWQPAPNPSSTVAKKKIGSGIDYRTVAESTTDEPRKGQKKAVTVAESTSDKPVFSPCTVVESTTQILLPPMGGFCSGASVLDPILDRAPSSAKTRRKSA